MSDSDRITRLNAALEGRYRIESELGEGGMATVYLAEDLKQEKSEFSLPRRSLCIWVIAGLLASAVGCSREVPESWSDWLVENHYPLRSLSDVEDFSDLTFLDDLLGSRRIVQLGENGHGVAEFNQIKVRLIRYLHEELGFNVVALESNFFACLQSDARLADLSVESLLSGCPTGVWHTDEMRDVLSYMIATQASPAPMHLVGFDVITSLGLRPQSRYFRRLLEAADPSFALEAEKFDSVSVDRLLAEDFDYVLENENRMVEGYLALADSFDSGAIRLTLSSEQVREWAIAGQAARSMVGFIRQGAADLRNHDAPDASFLRDSAMAENVQFLADVRFPDEKLVLWAHNSHIRNDGERVEPFHEKSMGQWLVEWRRSDVFTLGLTMGWGTARRNNGALYDVEVPTHGELESILRSVGSSPFVVNLSGILRSPGTEWAFLPQVARRDGTREEHFIPADQFDAILFIDEVTPARRR